MTSNTEPDQTLDCIGLYCPEPDFRTRIKLDEMSQGEVLALLAYDPAAEEDIKSLVKRTEHEILSISKEGNIIRFLIRKA